MPDNEIIGEQHPQPDPRGWLVFRHLPDALQRAEDSRQNADHAFLEDTGCTRWTRLATDTERLLLDHLGFEVPDRLMTRVEYRSAGVRNRRFPALENQESIA